MDNTIIIPQIEALINFIEQAKTQNHRYINLEKIATMFNIAPKDLDALITAILRLQELFITFLPQKRLIKVHNKGRWYLRISKMEENATCVELWLKVEECKVLSDIVHYFKHIARGKGFDLHFASTDLLRKVKDLKNYHPYFFEARGNGLIYPTRLALTLGTKLEHYNRMNRVISRILCEDHTIIIN